MSGPPPRRKGKEIPRLPLSAFSPPNPGTSDTFPIPPTPRFINPTGIVDAHLQITLDTAGAFKADTTHLNPTQKRAVVLSSKGYSAEAIARALPSLQSDVLGARVLSALIPFALDSAEIPESPVPPSSPFTAVYSGAITIAADAEEGTRDQAQVEIPVRNLRWAIQHGRVVDLDVEGGILDTDVSFYDSLVNLLTKAIKSDVDAKLAPVVLTNVLPPPLDPLPPVVTIMNHPTYTTYRQRVSLLSLFEGVCVKLLPPTWVSTESMADQEKDLKNVVKLFIAPVLEAFGFERIIFGSSPAFGNGSPAQAESWYRLVLDSFRELAVSQDELDKIFVENAERVYGST